MVSRRVVDGVIWGILLLLCMWLMHKSFGYNRETGFFYVARHQVGDFGLHLGIIRSFSQGDNLENVASPFYAGVLLPYHFGVDLLVGILERLGIPLTLALNGVSSMGLLALMAGVYTLSQILFGRSRLLGYLSVLFFLFHSDFSFFGYLQNFLLSFDFVKSLWRVSDYPYMGPFDGSQISILFSLNTYLNQRHLIVALAINIWAFCVLLSTIRVKYISDRNTVILTAIIVGLSFGVHSLVALATGVIILALFFVSRRYADFVVFAVLFGGMIGTRIALNTYYGIHSFPSIQQVIGFFAPRPLTIPGWIEYWIKNTGVLGIFVALSYLWSSRSQKVMLVIISCLFIVGNLIQLSYRLEHNQSVFNYFFVLVGIFAARAIVLIIQRFRYGLVIAVFGIFGMTISGILQLLVIKNDFRYPVADFSGSAYMRWIVASTPSDAIFLAQPDMYSPVTLSGRSLYVGPDYYITVMGIDPSMRKQKAAKFFQLQSTDGLVELVNENIDYVAIPKKSSPDFTYQIDWKFWENHIKKAYEDESISVYQL